MKQRLGFWFSLLVFWSMFAACSNAAAPSPSFTTINGQVIQPQQYQGQVVLLNFWATSCSTCVKEMPQLAATHLKYRERGLRTIAVAMQYDNPTYVRNFTATRQLPFDVVFDADGHLARMFEDTSVTPTTYLINRQGHIVHRVVGEPNFEQLHAEIEHAL